MTRLHEIENAIRTLSEQDRKTLIQDLPSLIPELDGDVLWKQIIEDPTPRPALTALLNEVDAEYQKNPNSFPEMKDSDFDAKQ